VTPLRRRLALALLALVVAASVPAYAVSVRKTHLQAVEREAWTPLERELVPTHMSLLEPELFLEARERIPPSETYAVIAGERGGAPQIAIDGAPQLAPYLLLPRRQVEPEAADWILSYGGDLDELRLEFEEVVRVAPGRELAEVRR